MFFEASAEVLVGRYGRLAMMTGPNRASRSHTRTHALTHARHARTDTDAQSHVNTHTDPGRGKNWVIWQLDPGDRVEPQRNGGFGNSRKNGFICP